jgi:hypothetical protein
MKYIITLIIIFSNCLSIYCQDYLDEMNNLKGSPIKAVIRIKGSSSNWKYVYTFNNIGKVMVQQNYENGTLRGEYHFEYDSFGNITKDKSFDIGNQQDSAQSFITEYTFDSVNRIKTVTLKYHGNKISWIEDSITYNSNNFKTSYIKTDFMHDSTIVVGKEKYELTYTETGFLAVIKMDEVNDEGFKDIYYWYNENDDIRKITTNQMIVYDGERIVGTLTREYSYKYDKLGNWVKRYVNSDNIRKYLEIKRSIEYEGN